MGNINNLQLSSIPIPNPSVISRKGLEDHLILVNCDTGNSIVLNVTGAYIWEQIDGKIGIDKIIERVSDYYSEVSEGFQEDIRKVIFNLEKDGFIGYEIESGL